MARKEIIAQEIEEIPEELLDEVLNFIRFLKARVVVHERWQIAIASESSLKKDWLRKEEDKAWQDL